MFRKRLAFMMVLIIVLSMLVPSAFALEPAQGYKGSDRYLDLQREGEEFRKARNPFGAEYASVGIDGEMAFELMSMPQMFMSQTPSTVGEKAYGHIVFLTKNIGKRVAASVYEEEARDYIKTEFEGMGYKAAIQPFSYRRGGEDYDSNNVIAVKPGKSQKEIIVGAHYDAVSAGEGADDNASGVGVMLEVAEALKNVPTNYTIRFIAFGAEEVGLQGSNYYASQMTDDEIKNTVAMINLDSLIAGDKMYVHGGIITEFDFDTEEIVDRYGSEEDGWVRNQALSLAKALGLNIETNPGLDVFDAFPEGSTGSWSDHAPFAKMGIPVAAFEGSNWEIGDKDGYIQTKKEGAIWHTYKDNLDFITTVFPGRVEERLETFTTLLYHLILNITPPLPDDLIGIRVDRQLLSLTEAREIEVVVDLGYTPGLENLEWTFGGVAFEEWKSYNHQTRGYTGPSFVNFAIDPYTDGNLVRAIIKFDLPYRSGNTAYNDLSNRNFRIYIEDLIGEYNLEVKDKTTKTIVKTPLKLNVYDTYHTHNQIKPAIQEIISMAKPDRYIEYKSLGTSYEGREIPFVIVAKDQSDITKYQNETLPMMLENPRALISKIENGAMGDYKPAIWFHNLHSDETPGIDAQIELIEKLATEDTVEFKTLDNGKEVTVELDMDEILDNFIFLFNVAQNPDGRYHMTRTTVPGFDPNRDMSYQTQVETRAVVAEIAKWSPMVFNDLHGFVKPLLIEPATPPHDPNFEYDLLMDGMLDHAHAMGKAGISNTKYDDYLIPLEDWGDDWDDSTIVYGAMYAMIHGAMGHTIEMPELNQDSHDVSVYLSLGSMKHVLENKEKLFKNQLEIYRRGVEGEDNKAVDKWFVNAAGESIGRPRNGTDSFFPEYYAIPVDNTLQKNILAAYEMIEYLLRNGVKVEKTSANVAVGEVSYPAGTYIVPLRQAKRGLANTLLYEGSDFSDWAGMYAETTQLFPDQRGFDNHEIRERDAFKGKSTKVTAVTMPTTTIAAPASEYVIQNTNNNVIQAVNQLLAKGKRVNMLYEAGEKYVKGDFVVSKADLESIKDRYYLEVVPFDGVGKTKPLKEPKVFVYGSELSYVMGDLLGFSTVGTLFDANVIADDGYAASGTIKSALEGGIPYVGTTGFSVATIQATGLLPGIERGRTAARYYEGALRATIDANHVITGRYNEEEVLYNKSASWIESVSPTSKVLATIVDRDDYFKAGWWPNNQGARGKDFILTDRVGNTKVTLFANHIVNRAHPQHHFRMLANAIYDSLIEDEKEPVNPPSSGGGGGSSISNNRITASKGGTVTIRGASITVPANALSEDVTITVEIVRNTSSLPISGLFKLVSDVFEIKKNIEGSFNKAITITLPFDKSKVDMDKYRIAIFWLNEETNEWVELDNIEIDLSKGTISGEIDHFTKFAVLAVEKEVKEATGQEKSTVNFTDIQGHWAEENIKTLVSSGAITGYSDGSFKPNNNITRAEFATVLVKAFGLETSTGRVFNDTQKHWAKDYIATAAAHGIVSGYNDSTFGPNDLITREQMAIMIVKAAKLNIRTGTTDFVDKDKISSWALGAVNTASENSIISGYKDDTFKPQANTTRAEAVTVIVKSLY